MHHHTWRSYREAVASAATSWARRREGPVRDASEAGGERFRSLVEHYPHGFFSMNHRGEFLSVNPAAQRLTGLDEHELLGRNFTRLVVPEERGAAQAAFAKTLRGESLELETVIHHPEGRRVDLHLISLPIVVDGVVVGVDGIAEDITERRRLERDLYRTSAAVASTMDGVAIADDQHRIVYVNEAQLQMHCSDRETLVGQPFTVLYDESQHARLWSVVIPALEREGRWHGIVTGRRADGGTFPQEVSVTRLEDGHVVSIARDITERITAEQALRLSEQRYRKILGEVAEGYYEVDLAGTFTFANESLCELLGRSRDGLLGMSNRDYSDPENAAKVVRHFRRVFETGETDRGFDWVFQKKDGSEGVVSTSVSLIRDDAGAPVGFRGITRDTTEQHRVEDSLRRNEELYQLVSRATQEVVWDADLLTGRSRWTGSLQSVFGYPIEVIDEDNAWWDERVHPDDKDGVLTALQSLFNSDEGLWVRDYRLRARDGHYVTIVSRGYVVRDPSGRPVRFVGSMMDISERRRHEEELQAARQEAEQANQAKSLFLAHMSHEIRTPMNGVIGMTELLMDTDLDPEQAGYAETVRRSGDHLLTIIDDILDFSRIEAGKMPVVATDFDLREVVATTAGLIGPSATQKGLEFLTDVDDAVPATVSGDAGRVSQVLTNLLGNAVKFTGSGRVALRVEVAGESAGATRVRFSVEDTGIGLSQEQQGRLFQPFTQADSSTTRQYGGTGLGLVISKQLVELLGGEIRAESEPGVGSTFSVVLPFSQPTGIRMPAAQRAAGPAYRAQIDNASGQAPRLLLAEDHAVNQQVAVAMLTKLGYTVDVVGDGVEALAALARQRYDAVLMDVQMPNLDGYETTAEIRDGEQNAHDDGRDRTPIIAITANAIEGDRQRALAAGMDDYLSKPFRSQALAEVLSRWVRPAPSDTSSSGQEHSEDDQGTRVLDPQVLATLRSLPGKPGVSLLEQLVPAFLHDARTQLDELAHAVEHGDLESVRRIAHTLKGSAGNMGAHRMSARLTELELAASRHEVDDLADLVTTLEAELRLVQAALADEPGAPRP